jgi:hypothetical protein
MGTGNDIVSPILITGAARSGTSMVGGVIDICGAFGGDMFGPNKQNQKGMFENRVIRDVIEKGYLKSMGVDPRAQNPLPRIDSLSIPNDWKGSVERVIKAEGYEEGAWFYKSAKASLIWPVWHHAYPNAKWVIVRRRTADIATSCLNTGFMTAFKTHEEWVKWVNWHEERWVEMIKAGLNVKIIWPERLVKGNYEQLYELIEWLGLEWKPEEVVDFIEPKLWKSKVKELKNMR